MFVCSIGPILMHTLYPHTHAHPLTQWTTNPHTPRHTSTHTHTYTHLHTHTHTHTQYFTLVGPNYRPMLVCILYRRSYDFILVRYCCWRGEVPGSVITFSNNLCRFYCVSIGRLPVVGGDDGRDCDAGYGCNMLWCVCRCVCMCVCVCVREFVYIFVNKLSHESAA